MSESKALAERVTHKKVEARDNILLLRRIPVFKTTDFDRLAGVLAANQPKTSPVIYDPTLPEDSPSK